MIIVAGILQPFKKPSQGNIGKAEQLVEPDPEALREFTLVVRLEITLGRRQYRPHRVVHEIEPEPRVHTVAQLVETPQGLDTVRIDPLAALLLDVFLEVAG